MKSFRSSRWKEVFNWSRFTEALKMTNAAEKKVKDEKTKEEKINEIMADGATMVKMEVDYRWLKENELFIL